MDEKELNRLNYQKKTKKYKNGKRPHSPWYYLIGKVEKRFFNKSDLDTDYPVNNVKPIKIKIKSRQTGSF